MLVKRAKAVNLAWLLCWVACSTAWCWTAARAVGPTFDEPFYLQAGLYNWHHLYHRELLTQGTMPLPAEVQTLPLLLAERLLGADPVHDWLEWLPLARMATTLFWWLLLWAVWTLARQYGGSALAGRIAVALVASEPILLGHASLATTDVAFTACLLAMLAVFQARRTQPSWPGRLIWPAVLCMLTFMAKASALVFVPVCLTLVELERLWHAGWRPRWSVASWKPVAASMRDLAVIGVMGIALLFLVCPRALRGLSYQVHHNINGHAVTYLFGTVNPNGYWYYFAAALAIKVGLPILIGLVLMVLLRPRYLLNGAIWAALGLLALTPFFHVQIGVRFVLPIAVLAMVGLAAAFGRLWAEQHSSRRRLAMGCGAAALVLWSLTNALLVWPHGICYTNELAGGTSRGYLALSDSNYDWGQGVKELAAWQRRHSEAPLSLWYFGNDPSIERLPCHSITPESLADGAELEQLCQGGFLGVSTTKVYGYEFQTPAAKYLRTLRPCDRTTTFLIYDFTRANAQAQRRRQVPE